MYLLLVLGILITTLLFLLYLRWRQAAQYWALRGVPHEKPHPLLGSLTFLQHQNTGIFFRKIYETFNTKEATPYIGIWYFWKPVLVINCPVIARNILVKDFGNFRNRFVQSSRSDTIGGANIFIMNDPMWSKVRQRLTPVFTTAKLRSLVPFIQQKTNELLQRIEIEKNNRFSLRDILADFTTDVIGGAAFGISTNATLTGEDPLRTITKEVMKYSVYRGISMSSLFFLPDIADIFRFTFFSQSVTDYFERIFRIIVSQRAEGDVRRPDLMDAILQIKKEAANDGEEYSDDLLLAQSLIFLQGGFDTTAVTLTFMFIELAFEPEIQEKLYIELLGAKEECDSANLSTEALDKLPYTNAVMKETLRKYPAMPWLDRVAAKDYKIDEKLTIKAGTPVAVNNIGIHFDPNYFPDPYKFDPDRFLSGNESNIRPHTYLPFGDGPRNCIGFRFGSIVIKLAMASLILNYKMEPYHETNSANNTQIEKRGLFYMPGEIVNLKFIPRA